MARIWVPDRKVVPYSGSWNATTSDINLGVGGDAHNINQAQTFIALVRRAGDGEGNFGYYFGKTPSASTAGLRWFDDTANNLTTFGVSSGTGSTPDRSSNRRTTAGAWEHIAVSYDGGVLAAGILLYYAKAGAAFVLDVGGSGASDGSGTAITGSALNMHVGNRQNTDRTFNGLIAYVARWNRILSTAEMELAKDHGPLTVPNGLILCWSGNRDFGPYGLKPSSTTAVTIGADPPNMVLG